MGMETIVIATKLNYGRVGLAFDNGHQLVQFMLLGFRGSPSLGLRSRWTCHFVLVYGRLWSRLCATKEAMPWVTKVSFVWILFLRFIFVLWLHRCHTYHPHYVGVFVGDSLRKDGLA